MTSKAGEEGGFIVGKAGWNSLDCPAMRVGRLEGGQKWDLREKWNRDGWATLLGGKESRDTVVE